MKLANKPRNTKKKRRIPIFIDNKIQKSYFTNLINFLLIWAIILPWWKLWRWSASPEWCGNVLTLIRDVALVSKPRIMSKIYLLTLIRDVVLVSRPRMMSKISLPWSGTWCWSASPEWCGRCPNLNQGRGVGQQARSDVEDILTLIKDVALVSKPRVVCLEASPASGTTLFSSSRHCFICALLHNSTSIIVTDHTFTVMFVCVYVFLYCIVQIQAEKT